jgi:preprotein translocase subunit SecE
MSRALRRQPLVQKPPAKTPAFKPTGPRPAKKQSAAALEAQKQHMSRYDRFVPRYLRDIISELKKVTWPTREDTTRLTIAVLVVSISIGLALGVVDIGFNWLIDNTLLQR